MRMHTVWHIRPTKTQSQTKSVHLRSLIRVFAVYMKILCNLYYPKCAHLRSWSKSLWAHMFDLLFPRKSYKGLFLIIWAMNRQSKAKLKNWKIRKMTKGWTYNETHLQCLILSSFVITPLALYYILYLFTSPPSKNKQLKYTCANRRNSQTREICFT